MIFLYDEHNRVTFFNIQRIPDFLGNGNLSLKQRFSQNVYDITLFLTQSVEWP